MAKSIVVSELLEASRAREGRTAGSHRRDEINTPHREPDPVAFP